MNTLSGKSPENGGLILKSSKNDYKRCKQKNHTYVISDWKYSSRVTRLRLMPLSAEPRMQTPTIATQSASLRAAPILWSIWSANPSLFKVKGMSNENGNKNLYLSLSLCLSLPMEFIYIYIYICIDTYICPAWWKNNVYKHMSSVIIYLCKNAIEKLCEYNMCQLMSQNPSP